MNNNSLILESYCIFQDNFETYNKLKVHNETNEQLKNAMNKLKDLLPKNSDTYFEIDEVIGTIISCESRKCYFAGFVDGANLIMDIKK